ncbi:MAG: flagellar hook-basal body complex protein [Alphaproteobacteria bacterium]
MGIFGALNTAVSGLRAQSFALENISGNIANSQTTAFKRQDTTFSDLVTGGSNSAQYQTAGSVSMFSRSTATVQGDISSSSINTHMAVSGDGYFIVQEKVSTSDNRAIFSGTDVYTRRGDFTIDAEGYLVNGSGYYLKGLELDPTTGNPVGSVPELIQLSNDFLPAQATQEIDYRANLASYPLTANADPDEANSELLNPINFSANPIASSTASATITGSGATLAVDAIATDAGTTDLSGLSSAGGTLILNGTSITINAADDATATLAAINLETGTTGISASLGTSNELILESADADTDIDIGSGSTASLLTELGLADGTTGATNLISQGAVTQGETLTVDVASGGAQTITFGTGVGEVSTLAELNTALAGLAGVTASVNTSTGDISIEATSSTASLALGGTVDEDVFGITAGDYLPAAGVVVANDNTAFISSSVSGGAITVYDENGSPVNIQFRWAKVDSDDNGGTDTWNMFYLEEPDATGTDTMWRNIGQTYTFGSDGTLDPVVSQITLSGIVVDGANLGDINLIHGTGGLTQYDDPNGNVQVNDFSQDGLASGELVGVQVADGGTIVANYSNGLSLNIVDIPLVSFNADNGLLRLDGGAFEATSESGQAILDSTGAIVGQSIENSNTDIADEFSKLIVTQQAYSANSRIVSTADEMLQEALNMVR